MQVKTKVDKFFNKLGANPPLVLSLGFMGLIIIGGLILSLGICTNTEGTKLVDAFFVAGSASCVTGLTTVNTAEHWNIFGQVVILILIQIGGLGIMTAATLLPMVLGQKIGLKSRLILSEQFNVSSLKGVVKFFRATLRFTFIVEFIGALILSIRFIPDFGLAKGLWYGVFHSVSAFCNAGFDIMGDSIYPYKSDALVNLTIMALVIIGGLGFFVNMDILNKGSFRRLDFHSKIVLIMNLGLLIVGSLMVFALEYTNPLTLGEESFKTKIFQSSFQSVVARTAGFYSVRLEALRDSTSLVLIILMFIGASPGSTGGGIKTTTFGVLLFSTLATIKGHSEPEMFNRVISTKTIKKALAITVIYLSAILGTVFLISIFESAAFIDIFYEIVSAFATVGASKGITSSLSMISKLLLIISMYAGRLGPLTLAFALTRQNDKKVKHPVADLAIG